MWFKALGAKLSRLNNIRRKNYYFVTKYYTLQQVILFSRINSLEGFLNLTLHYRFDKSLCLVEIIGVKVFIWKYIFCYRNCKNIFSLCVDVSWFRRVLSYLLLHKEYLQNLLWGQFLSLKVLYCQNRCI